MLKNGKFDIRSGSRIITVIIAVATDVKSEETEIMRRALEKIAQDYSFRVEVKIYSLNELTDR